MAKHPQHGILSKPVDHAVLAALNLQTADPATTRAALEQLRELIKDETKAVLDHTDPTSPKDQPSAETGELGFQDGYETYRLSIVVAFSKSTYDKLGVAADQQPQDLIAEPVIPWAKLSDPDPGLGQGDLTLQITSDSVYVNEHVVRRVEHDLSQSFTVLWTLAGQQRHHSREAPPSRREGRALIGFLDGTSNLDPRNSDDDAKLVFVDPAHVEYPQVPTEPEPTYGGDGEAPHLPPDLRPGPTSEPEWAKNGSYVVVRASVLDMARWDGEQLGTQERSIGRWKVSGSALDHPDDPTQPPAEPDFAADPTGEKTPLDAHIRKANPRSATEDDAQRRIFRRGYPLVLSGAAPMRRGLIFICFGRTISTQFEFIFRAWVKNSDFPHPDAGIDAFLKFENAIVAGGYYFAAPLDNDDHPWSWHLPE